MSFYQKNEAKRKFYTLNFFEQFGVTNKQVYYVIAWRECGELYIQKKGKAALQKLSKL